MTSSDNNTLDATSTPLAHLTILSTRVRRDSEGRYCLNDCHKAAGGADKDAPAKWLRSNQARGLVAALTDGQNRPSPLSTIKGGPNQGTFVAKELVYAYAMWISPAFHLTVIRAFDALVQASQAHVAIAKLDPEAVKVIGGVARSVVLKQIAPLQQMIATLTERCNALAASYDPTAGFITDHSPMSAFINPLVPNPRKRGALVRQASKRCARWLIAAGKGDKMRISRESARHLFQHEAAREWLEAEGKMLIIAHNDRIAGQTVMQFKSRGT